jgi:hypothetical protein
MLWSSHGHIQEEKNHFSVKSNKDIGNFYGYVHLKGTLLVVQLDEELRYSSEGRGFNSRCCHLEFFIGIILPAALWPWGQHSL